MTWVKLDDAIGEHPKIAQIDDHALALFITGLAYCNRNLTDGFIPSAVGLGQLRFCDGNAVPAIRQLELVSLWHPVAGGWQVHDFQEYQPSAQQVLAERDRLRAARSKAGAKGAEARWHGKQDGNADGTTLATGMATEWQNDGAVAVAVAVTETVTVTEKSKTKPAPPFFNEFWDAFADKRGRPEAEKAYKRAIEHANPQDIIRGALEYRAWMQTHPDPPSAKMAQGWLSDKRWTDNLPPHPTKPDRAMVWFSQIELTEALARRPDRAVLRLIPDWVRENYVSGREQDLVATIRAFAQCSLNVKETARKLRVHTNTVYFRLNQVKKRTGVDPRTFAGTSLLITALRLLDNENGQRV